MNRWLIDHFVEAWCQFLKEVFVQGKRVVFFKENGTECLGVVIHYDPIDKQVIVQDSQGNEWVGKPEQVFDA